MALELIAGIVVAIGMAGFAMFLRKLSGGRIAKWIVPAAAGAGLIGFTIWIEYTWFARTSAELPDRMVIVKAETAPSPLRPWSYIWPMTTQFMSLDPAATMAHPDAPSLRVVSLYSTVRWQGATNAMMIVDCENARQVLVTAGVEVTPDAQMTGGEWITPGPGDGIQQAACGED
jgi:hypothetical protein